MRRWLIILLWMGQLTNFLFAQRAYRPPHISNTIVAITIKHEMNGNLLQFNHSYTNGFKEDFTVTKFKYYISHLQLLKAKEAISLSDSAYLIDESLEASKHLKINIPPGKYNGFSFLIGVDSLHNNSGAQTGSLDPMLGMFWTWNSGYIMAKLEGTSPLSHLPDHRIEYHIGGYRSPYNAARPVTLYFKKDNPKTNHLLMIQLRADLQNWFNSKQAFSIKAHPGIITPGPLACAIADNYSTMFTLTSVASN